MFYNIFFTFNCSFTSFSVRYACSKCRLHIFLGYTHTFYMFKGKLEVPKGTHIDVLPTLGYYERVLGFITHSYISPCRMRADTFT